MSYAWINGRLVDDDDASIAITDGGLLHGVGVFTTMRADQGHVFHLSSHLERLRSSCDNFNLVLDHDDQSLGDAIGQLLAANQLQDARLRLTVTRNPALTSAKTASTASNTILTAAALQTYPQELYQRGMTVQIEARQKLNPFDIQAGHKTLNYLSRLTALQNARQHSMQEALWLNIYGYLESGSVSNLFVFHKNRLITPPTPADMLDQTIADTIPYPRSAVLPGITRATVLTLAKQMSIEVLVGSLTTSLLYDAEELFLTNSIMRIMPVTRIAARSIGTGKPGPITRELSEALQQAIQKEHHNEN